MLCLQSIDIDQMTREELLPGFDPAFPHIATQAELDRYPGVHTPWHWHRTVELFYVRSGKLTYSTPDGSWIFPAGSGGLVNFNVLHASRPLPSPDATIQLLHLFDPALLSGGHGTPIESKYILPLTTSGISLIPLYPDDPAHQPILELLRSSFLLDANAWGYEFRLREALEQIWIALLSLTDTAHSHRTSRNGADEVIKALMVYIHEHAREKLTVDEIAASAHISRRACFRVFQEKLRMTPMEYLLSFRLQMARQMLTQTQESVTQIAYACGFGASSYFGKQFRAAFGCTPMQYRLDWHDRHNIRQNVHSNSPSDALK